MVVRPGHYRLQTDPPFVGNLVGKTGQVDVPSLADIVVVLDDVAP
jgi:hypothetical protein